MIEEVESSTGSERLKLYIIIAMCVMIVIAAVAGLMWKSKTERDEREAKAASVAAENAMGDIQRIIHDDPENFDKQLEAIKAAEDKVKNFGAHRNNLLTIQSEVTGKKEAFETKKQAGEILAQLKKDLQDPSKLDSVSLTIGAAKRFESSQGPEFKAELKAIEEQLTLAVLKRAFDAAKAKEAAGDPAQALAAYDEAVVTFNKMFDKMTVVPKPLVDLYKELLAESDKLVERTETPDYEASVPERDMLSTKERPLWGGSEGIKFAFSGRELKIDGVDSGKKITGIFSLVPPRATPWHDIVIDLEFTILSEGFEMFVRHEQGKKPYRIGFKPSDNYELNKPYRMTLRVKGSSLTLKAPDQPENRDKFEATTSRTGGIAFGLNKGASVVISSCKIKVLRPKGG